MKLRFSNLVTGTMFLSKAYKDTDLLSGMKWFQGTPEEVQDKSLSMTFPVPLPFILNNESRLENERVFFLLWKSFIFIVNFSLCLTTESAYGSSWNTFRGLWLTAMITADLSRIWVIMQTCLFIWACKNWPQRQEIETVRENSCYETKTDWNWC